MLDELKEKWYTEEVQMYSRKLIDMNGTVTMGEVKFIEKGN